MAKCNPSRPPGYRHHKATGQAVVTIDGKDHYLGKHGTPDSRLRYERLISRWLQAPGEAAEIGPTSGGDITIAELCAQFFKWASSYYVKDGRTTSELNN